MDIQLKKYFTEAVARVERMLETLVNESKPLPVEDTHSELDNSPLLGINDHRKFQILLGMLQWMVAVAKPHLSTTVASLNLFGACPRERYL